MHIPKRILITQIFPLPPHQPQRENNRKERKEH